MKKQSLAGILALALCLSSSFAAFASGEQVLPQGKQQAMKRAVEALTLSAFAAKDSGSSSNYMIRWEDPLRIYVTGAYTREDMSLVERFIRDLNARVTWLPDVSMVNLANSANITITMAKLDELASFNNPGYVEDSWDPSAYEFEDNLINSADILIASDVTTQEERNYFILTKLTSILGLTHFIPNFPDSILSKDWTYAQNLSELDWLTLNLLYDPLLYPGITAEDAYDTLTGAAPAVPSYELDPDNEPMPS